MTSTPHGIGRELYALAHEIDYVRTHLPEVQHPGALPSLETVAWHLDKLNALSSDAVGGVWSRLADTSPRSDTQRRAIGAFTSAAADIGDAVSHLSRALQQLGLRGTDQPGAPDPHRSAAETVAAAAAHGLDQAREALADTGTTLRAEADQLLDLPRTARAEAARARSRYQPPTRPVPGPAVPPSPPGSPLPRRHP